MAAILSPWLYSSGKWLADHAQANELPGVLDWLGKKCASAQIDRYFSRALTISALLLLPFLFKMVKSIRRRDAVVVEKIPAMPPQTAALQLITALIVAGGLLWLAGSVLEYLGAYKPHPKSPGIFKALKGVLPVALIVALLEEWLFRGVMLGLWLRFTRPLPASLGCSLVFAFLHFVEPPVGTVIADPSAPLAGFQLLGSILGHFVDPLFFITDFATLFLVGMILANARIKTGKLWFSIGLHAGWIVAFQGFGKIHKMLDPHPLQPWWVGGTLRSGVLPLITLALTAVICHFVLKLWRRPISPA